MAFDIRNTSLCVAKPNTGWPYIYVGESFKWAIDLTNDPEITTPTYSAIEIIREIDGTDVTTDWSISGAGTQGGKTIVAETAQCPTDALDVEHYAKIWFIDDSVTQLRVIPFRVIKDVQ